MTADIGHSTQMQRSDDGTSGGSFASVGSIREITPPALSRDSVDVTAMDSADAFRQFIPGLKDPGEMSVVLEFDPSEAVQTSWESDFNSSAIGYYKIIFPDSTEWGFTAFVTAYEPETPIDGEMRVTVTLKLTGKPGFIA